MPSSNLLTSLLPLLATPTDTEFNVFDVLHHGTHEKQLSNGFRWLLEIGGTHNFEDLGQRLFIDILNSNRADNQSLPSGQYSVRQEVNTSEVGDQEDIADIVLESKTAVIVIENYHTSDGHGHGYERYENYGRKEGKLSTVVLLCAEENRALLTLGWEQAQVVTYEQFLSLLMEALTRDPQYSVENPNQYAFIKQMHLKFAQRKGRMDNEHTLDFVVAMCATGEAQRYQIRDKEVAAETFANAMAQQARENFDQSRETLQVIKAHLRNYGETVLLPQLNETMGYEFITKVSIGYSGIYQWTVDFTASSSPELNSQFRFQIKFGPSAWYANEQDGYWETKVDAEHIDYSRLFITDSRARSITQSSVSLHDVLSIQPLEDTRLHDEILACIQPST